MMRIESTVVVEQKRSDSLVSAIGATAARPRQRQLEVPAVEVRGLDQLIATMRSFQDFSTLDTWTSAGTLIAEKVDTPLPYRISLAIEEADHTLRIRETVELGTLPAPGGPRAVHAIKQQIEQDLALWQHRLAQN